MMSVNNQEREREREPISNIASRPTVNTEFKQTVADKRRKRQIDRQTHERNSSERKWKRKRSSTSNLLLLQVSV